jgi:hypothetical protein
VTSNRNYTALIRPVAPTEVAAFRQSNRSTGSTAHTVILVLGSVFGALFALFFAVIFATVIVASGFGPIQFVMVLFLAAVIALAVYGIVKGLRGNWLRRLRKSEFARDNGFIFAESASAPGYPGLIFGQGSSRSRPETFFTVQGRQIEVANYRYTTGSGKNQSTHNWGYLVITLDRNLPHMLLDAKGNNSLFGSNLPQMFTADQRLSLEGDFDNYFTLYCPREYERDALYVMTPDLMALLIDNAAPYDIEILDNQMFVYSARAFDLSSPHVWQRLFQIIDIVGAKAVAQTDRYADERIGDPTVDFVAPAGQRLRRGFPLWFTIGLIVVVSVFAIFFVQGILAG